jgi:hypothetical protein
MSRLLSVLLLATLMALTGCGRLRNRPLITPAPLDVGNPQSAPAATPAPATEPPHVTVARQFFAALGKGDAAAAYGLATDHYRALVSQKDFAAMLADVAIKDAQPMANAQSGNVGYVVMSVTLAKPVASGPPIAGYSALLKKSPAGQWQVALFLAEEKLASKYQNLLIIPAAKGKGYIVTYADETGKQSRSDLQEP